MRKYTMVCAGELRTDLLAIFDPCAGIDIVVATPGSVGQFKGIGDIHANPHERIGSSGAHAYRNALFDSMKKDVDRLPQSEEWAQRIEEWCKALADGEARCFYYMRRPVFTRMISRSDTTAVCAAPITTEGISCEHELNVELSGDEHRRAQEWITSLIADSQEITDELRDLLLQSWAGLAITPREFYYKVLSEYFWETIEGLDLKADLNPLLEQLTEFQLRAYQYAKGILRRYGGVFLADVVGLGKTFIGLALLRHLQDRYGEHAVVIAPPNVLPAWEKLAADFRIEIQTVSIGKLDDLDEYQDREVLLIDESHNFRNKGTQRYERIQKWLRPDGEPSNRRVLLLSATPQNNSHDDVKHQLSFFPDNYARLPYRGESLDTWFTDVARGQASLTELLQHIVVRRTRRYIQSTYPNATLRVRTAEGGYEHVPLCFPERKSGPEQCLRYSINETYGGDLYKEILTALAKLNYAPYSLSVYLTAEGAEDHRVAGLRRAGTSIRGLYKTLLLKRLESSVVAFRNTLSTLLTRLGDCLRRLAEGQVMIRVRERDPNSEDRLCDLVAEERIVASELFDMQRLQRDLIDDRNVVKTLQGDIDRINAAQDAKVIRLCTYLKNRNPREHRTIVFTQFADTANYIGEVLGQHFGRTEVVTGGKGNALRVAQLFSPKSNRIVIPEEDEIDLLISTDALSEGVNLQDADTLINYDIHWNPVRLIQRAGRIDRIGSEHDVIDVASFLPETALEIEFGIEAVLRERITEFLQVFGEDSNVLPTDDLIEVSGALSAFNGSALEEDNEDMDGLSRHVDKLLQLRDNEPAEYALIQKLRVGRHAVSTASNRAPICASRLGWFWCFWEQSQAGDMRMIDDLRGLDALYGHSEAEACESAPENARRHLGQFIDLARSEFTPLAESFRQQRLAPQLQAAESFVLERLERYKRTCIATRRDHVVELIAWVRSGVAQRHLRPLGKRWKKEKLAAETVFNEVRVLFTRFPVLPEELGDVEIVGAVMGVPRGE